MLENGWKTPAHVELEKVAVRMKNIRIDIMNNYGHMVTELPVLYIILTVAVKCDIYMSHVENAITRNQGGPSAGGPYRPITAPRQLKGHALLPRPRRRDRTKRQPAGGWARRRAELRATWRRTRTPPGESARIAEAMEEITIE